MKKTMQPLKFKLFLWTAILFLSVSGTIHYNANAIQAETTVYVTPSGSKYHTHACGRGSYSPTSLSNALARGLTPCSKCFGSGYTPTPDPAPSPAPSPSPTPTPSPAPAPKPIKINKTSVLLLKGKTTQLKISNATEKVSWTSSKKSVATVSAKGKVTAKKKGTAVITAKSGSAQKKCKITVEAPKLSAKKISLALSQKKTLKLSGCKHSVKWSSSDPDTVKVSKGTITAKEVGTAKISAMVHGKKFTCKVTVKKPKVQKITLKPASVKMKCGEDKEVKVRISPANALDYYTVSVKSSNPSVVSASFDNYENILTLESDDKPGTATISISIGGKTIKCPVTVTAPAITSLELSESTIYLKSGESTDIYYISSPSDAGYYYDAVWKSKDESVAIAEKASSYYDSTFICITAVGEGETDITLTLGNKTVSCHIIVQP